jgi:hypothetical protein
VPAEAEAAGQRGGRERSPASETLSVGGGIWRANRVGRRLPRGNGCGGGRSGARDRRIDRASKT